MARLHTGLIFAAMLLCSREASAAPAQKTTFKQEGNIAFAQYSETNGCLLWTVTVSLAERSTRTGPQETVSTNDALLTFQRFDGCEQTQTFFQVNVPDAAKFQGNVSSATVSFNLSVTATTCTFSDGFSCSDQPLQASGSISWAGSGGVDRDTSRFAVGSPGLTQRITTKGSSREATVSGSVTIDGATYTVTPDNIGAVALSSNTQTTITITRN